MKSGLNKKKQDKFDKKGEVMIMVGYSMVTKAYRLYDTKSARFIERRDVLFDETNFPGGENKKTD